MKYESARAFRDALESRLKAEATTDGAINSALLGRLRKRLTFERFLARLHHVAPDAWVLKGGFALELRLGNEARTTKDMDVDWLTAQEDAIEHLLDAASAELGDHFEFEIEREELDLDVGGQGQRWKVKASLAGRTFENVSLDIGAGAPVVPTETLSLPPMLDFADLATVKIPSLSIEQHLAEKVHAYTRLYGEEKKVTSRAKDLIDMALVAVALTPRAKELDQRHQQDLRPARDS